MEPITLLVVARTQSLAGHLRTAFDVEQCLIRWVPSVAQALKLGLEPSLVVLDLPSSGGMRSAARLKRAFQVPVVALAHPEQSVPPQVDASLDRSRPVEQLVELIEITLIDHSPDKVRAAGMSLDQRTRRLQINGLVYQLRPIGCQILALLMGRAGKVIPRDEVFQRVWRTDDGDNTRALDVHIAQLRRQLEPDPRHPQLIITERGVGYRLQPPA